MNFIKKTIITTLSASCILLGATNFISAETQYGRPDGVGRSEASERPEGTKPDGVGRPNGKSCRGSVPFGNMFSKMRMMHKLDLNEIQRSNLVSVKDLMMEIKQARQDNSPRKQVLALLSQPVFDQQAALSIIETRTANIQEYAPQIITAIATFTDSLTDAQRAEMQKMSEQNSEGCNSNKMRGEVSNNLDFFVPSTKINSAGENSDFWVDLKYKGKDDEGNHSWRLRNYGEN
ncbi:MAG: hypothetical protein KAG26_03150 [Methylococcales bacterium]|nr:hypothetical protein [Methylococcales bacterium]